MRIASSGTGAGWAGLKFGRLVFLSSILLVQESLFGALNQQPAGGSGNMAPQGAMSSPGMGGAQPDDLRDILPPVDVPYWTPGMIAAAVVAGLVVAGLLVWGVVVVLRRQKPSLPPPSPREVALAALKRLKGEAGAAMTSGDFAAEVGVVLRRYLEAIYGIQVTRQTTEEFLAALEADLKFGQEERDQLRRFLNRCDRFKFAGESVDSASRVELIEVVEEWVQRGNES